jgi:ABC-type transport system involved in multi-copper enzyme maturation permease subunit
VRLRLGPGPVFVYEWLTTTRRWQLYAIRAAFVALILVGMILIWHNVVRFDRPGQAVSIQQMARYGEAFYETVSSIELTLVLLVAPAATAGAVCLDKARGTLEHMLATDLSNAEIVLGKLGVRLAPVLGLVACVLPITALSGLLGGIDPDALFGSFLVAIGCAVLGCSLAIALSVWGRKTHEVLMLTYLILILWLSSPVLMELVAFSLGASPPPRAATGPWGTLWQCAELSNPYYLDYAPYTEPGRVGWTNYLAFLGGCLAGSGLFVGLATWRVRGVALKQAGRPAAPRRRWWVPRLPRLAWLPQLPGPSLEGNPVLWREWHRSKPSRFLRVAWLLYSGLGVLWVLLALQIATSGRRGEEEIGGMNMFQVVVGLLLVSVSAATSLAEERVRGSLDVLLSTPLSTRSILVGKWWGAFRQVRHVLIWPAVTTALLAAASGRLIAYLALLGLISAYAAAIISLGLALATWVSRLGRAVALCVAAYVAFSIGWVILVLLPVMGGHPGNDHWLVPLVMGSPLYGMFFATMAATPEPLHMPGERADIWFGTTLWILVHGGVAAFLFAATRASFDRCLGRVSETPGRPIPGLKKKLAAEPEPEF